jgi:hypothetical protein
MTVAFLFLVVLCVGGVAPYLLRWLARHVADGATDPALHIRPPRRVVDTDRRSDFRPERYAAFVNGRQRDAVIGRDQVTRAERVAWRQRRGRNG